MTGTDTTNKLPGILAGIVLVIFVVMLVADASQKHRDPVAPSPYVGVIAPAPPIAPAAPDIPAVPSLGGGVDTGYENPAAGDDGSFDCVPGQAPVYVGTYDPAGLDGDGDGWGCE